VPSGGAKYPCQQHKSSLQTAVFLRPSWKDGRSDKRSFEFSMDVEKKEVVPKPISI
jgi:hypothetical protein